MWLKADAITGVANGSPVTTWTDSSGNSQSATGSGGTRPTLVTNVINSKPVVRFVAGSAQEMSVPATNFPAGSAARSIFAVGIPRSATARTFIFSYGGGDQAQLWDLEINGFQANQNGKFLVGTFNGGRSTTSATAAPVDTAGLFNCRFAGVTANDIRLFVNGSEMAAGLYEGATSAQGHTLNTTAGNGRLGTRWIYPTNANYDAAEYLVFASALTDAEHQKVEGYLANKYGLTANLPSDHPYKNGAP
jgi:hypothetical protein